MIQGNPSTIASDLYSFGVILYECLAGAPPFPGPEIGSVLRQHLQQSPPSISTQVTRELHPIVLALLSKDPMRRPASAVETLRLISNASGDVSLEPHTSVTWLATTSTFQTVGRTQMHTSARSLLANAFNDHPHAEPHVLVISGEKGIGKTRFLSELAVFACGRGFRVRKIASHCFADDSHLA